MISEKKYKLEVEKLMKIINKLREERNLSLINYQKISSDIYRKSLIILSKLETNSSFSCSVKKSPKGTLSPFEVTTI